MRCIAWLSIALLALVLNAACAPRRDSPSDHSQNPKPVSSSSALFRDIAEEAGIRFTLNTGANGKFRFIESTPAGCALFDYDNDGFLDLLLIQSGPSEPLESVQDRPTCALYHNRGNGTF